jgi:hypothetical protein
MKMRLATLCGLLLLPAALAAQETQDTMRVPAELRTARVALNKAFTSADPTAAAPFFADSSSVDFRGEVYNGHAAVTGWLQQALQGISSLRFSAPTFVVSPTEITERLSYTVGTPEGDQTGQSEAVWRKQRNGSWKVVRMRVT